MGGRCRCVRWQEPLLQAAVPDGRRRCCWRQEPRWAAGATVPLRMAGDVAAVVTGAHASCGTAEELLWAAGAALAAGGASGRVAAPGGRSRYVGRQETLLRR